MPGDFPLLGRLKTDNEDDSAHDATEKATHERLEDLLKPMQEA
jgi:hypothetical protein